MRLEWISAAEGEKVKHGRHRHGQPKVRPLGPLRACPGSIDDWDKEMDELGRTRQRKPRRRRLLMPTKPKIGFYWCASCGGCEEAVVDLAEDILRVSTPWTSCSGPARWTSRRRTSRRCRTSRSSPRCSTAPSARSEQEEMAHLLRRKSQYLIAYGACAHTGGIPALANQFTREHILKYVYEECADRGERGKTRPLATFSDNGRDVDAARDPQCGPRARPGGRCGLLPARLPADAEADQGRGAGAARGQAAAQRQRAGARHRSLPANARATTASPRT